MSTSNTSPLGQKDIFDAQAAADLRANVKTELPNHSVSVIVKRKSSVLLALVQ